MNDDVKNLLYFPGNFNTIQTEPQTNSPVDLPDWLLDELYKVQAAWGVPVRILIINQLENFVADNWNFEIDGPKKKPRVASRRSCTKQNKGGIT